MTQKTQTLIIYQNGDVAKRIDNFLYQPITDVIILKGEVWKIHSKQDEFDCEDWLVRKIHLTK